MVKTIDINTFLLRASGENIIIKQSITSIELTLIFSVHFFNDITLCVYNGFSNNRTNRYPPSFSCWTLKHIFHKNTTHGFLISVIWCIVMYQRISKSGKKLCRTMKTILLLLPVSSNSVILLSIGLTCMREEIWLSTTVGL